MVRRMSFGGLGSVKSVLSSLFFEVERLELGLCARRRMNAWCLIELRNRLGCL